MMSKWKVIICFILIALLLPSCALLPEEEILPPPIIPRMEIPLVTEVVGRGDIVDYVRVSGRATPVTQHNIYLGFDIFDAILVERHVDTDNLRVQEGDILAVFAADEIETRTAPLERALELAQINYNAAVRSLEDARAHYETLQSRTEIVRTTTLEGYARDIARLQASILEAERMYGTYRALFDAGATNLEALNARERTLRELRAEIERVEASKISSELLLNSQHEQSLRSARADARDDAAVLRERVNLRAAEDNVRELRERTENFVLRAPVDGLITYFTELFIGDTYRYNQRLFTIADDSQLFVTIAFADQRHLFAPGNEVELLSFVSGGEDRRDIEFYGTVISLSTDQRRDALLDDNTVVISVSDWPEEVAHGDLVWVYLNRASVYDVVVIPLSALSSINDFHFVRVAENGISRERQVEVGIRSATMVEIVRGLSPGEEIVVR